MVIIIASTDKYTGLNHNYFNILYKKNLGIYIYYNINNRDYKNSTMARNYKI